MGRPDLNRQRRREALREQLKSSEYLRQIHGILEELGEPAISRDDVIRLKARMQGYFNLLAKTLPDVKAVELDAVLQAPNATKEDLERSLQGLGIDPRLITGGAKAAN